MRESVLQKKYRLTGHGVQRKFKMHHYVAAVKKYEATAGYSEALRGQVGAAPLELSTSAGLRNTEHINNCGFVHLPQAESCIHPVKNVTNNIIVALKTTAELWPYLVATLKIK